MQRLIELFIDTNTMELYNRDGALGASTPSISAGELVQLNVQLCDGAPDFDESGAVTNPDTRFAGTLAAGEFVVDNNYNWYDPVTIMDAVTAGSAIETLEIQSTTTPRTLGTIIIAGTDYVNYCESVKTETGYLLTLADAEFSPAAFTPSVNCDAGSAARNLERPVIVSAQNDSTGRETGLFTGLLDAANPVYESLIEGNKEISGTILEVNIYDEGRSVFRARFDFDCLGAIAASSSAGYIKSNVWTEADSRYIRLSDWTQPDEYQFSADGSTEWHDTQTDDDVYIRIRRPAGEWGQAIKLPAGPQGPQGPQGPAGSGSGDMLKSEYDTDNDGKVDAADEADDALNVGGKTAAQVATAVDNSHTHSNKTTLDKLGESGGKLTFNGSEVGGGGTADSVAWENVTGKPSTFPPADHTHEIANVNGLQSALDAKGTVKTVNGVEPDSSGNVTIETGGGGLTSVSVGNGLTGNGTSGNPIKLDLSNAVMEHDCNINAQSRRFGVYLLNEVEISATSISLTSDSLELITGPINIFIQEDSLFIDASQILLNRHNQNTAGGFAIVGEDGKLPSSIIPVSSNRHPFTSSDLSSNVLTITTTGNVTGVIDDSGKAWNFADEEVTYTDSTVSVDLSGVLARKGIVTPAGTWKLMLYGA